MPSQELLPTVEAITPVKVRRTARGLPAYPGSTRAVQDSEWRLYVRDHDPKRDHALDRQRGISAGPDIELTFTEWALASLYGTYGTWGQKAYPSDSWISKRFHVKRETVARAREGLLSKGLIRCIGQAPNGQPNQFMYCLTLPVDVMGVGPISGNGCTPNGHQDIQEIDKERRTSTPAGPVDDAADAHGFLSQDVLEQDVQANVETLTRLLRPPRKVNVKALARELDKLSRLAGEQYSVSEILDTFPAEDERWERWRSGRSPVGRMVDDLTRDIEGS